MAARKEQLRLGQRVQVLIDTERLDDVIVNDAAGKVICLAKADRRLPQGASSQDIRDARADMRRNKRKARDYIEARTRMALDTVELMRQRQAKMAAEQRQNEQRERAATGTDDVASIRPVRTPFDDQSAAVRAAVERATPASLRPADAGGDLTQNHGRFTYQRPQRDEEDDS